MNATTWPPKISLCVGMVVQHAGKVLLIREAAGHDAGIWGIPWGFVEGRMADGTQDTPERAAVRETREEAGIQAQIVGLLGIQNHTSRTGEPRLYLIFLGEHVRGEPQPDGSETDRAAYLSLEEIQTWPEPIDAFVLWVIRRVLTDHYTLTKPQITPYNGFVGFF